MNHNNVISLPAGDTVSMGDIVTLNSLGDSESMSTNTTDKEKAIGAILHDADFSFSDSPFDIHLFSGAGVCIIKASTNSGANPISVGDLVGIDDGDDYVSTTGGRILGLALESQTTDIGLIRMILTARDVTAVFSGGGGGGQTMPAFTSNGGGASASINIAENATTTIYNAANGGGVTFSISGPDAALFYFSSNTGNCYFHSGRDFENPTDADGNNDYEITVTATNTIGSDTQDITVTVTDVYEAPAPLSGEAIGLSESYGEAAGSISSLFLNGEALGESESEGTGVGSVFTSLLNGEALGESESYGEATGSISSLFLNGEAFGESESYGEATGSLPPVAGTPAATAISSGGVTGAAFTLCLEVTGASNSITPALADQVNAEYTIQGYLIGGKPWYKSVDDASSIQWSTLYSTWIIAADSGLWAYTSNLPWVDDPTLASGWAAITSGGLGWTNGSAVNTAVLTCGVTPTIPSGGITLTATSTSSAAVIGATPPSPSATATSSGSIIGNLGGTSPSATATSSGSVIAIAPPSPSATATSGGSVIGIVPAQPSATATSSGVILV